MIQEHVLYCIIDEIIQYSRRVPRDVCTHQLLSIRFSLYKFVFMYYLMY